MRDASPRAPTSQQTAAHHRRHDPLAHAAEKANLVSISIPPVCGRATLSSIELATYDFRLRKLAARRSRTDQIGG